MPSLEVACSASCEQASSPKLGDLSQEADLFLQQGFIEISSFLSSTEVGLLQRECDSVVEEAQSSLFSNNYCDREWAARHRGCVFETVPRDGARDACCSFSAFVQRRVCFPLQQEACCLLFGQRMRQLVQAMLRTSAYLFNEQYIVKPSLSRLSSFGWHRDSDWCRDGDVAYCKYISVWVALDDMMQGNGGLMIIPKTAPAEQQAAPASTAPQPCSEAISAAVALEVPAGTAVVMDDTVWHCSGPNCSKRTRRAWMPQFSERPIMRADGTAVSLAVPMEKGGPMCQQQAPYHVETREL